MKKLLAALMAAGLLVAVGTVAQAAPKKGEDHGPCTAYFNGNKNGHTEGDSPGALGELEQTSTAYDAVNGGNDENLETEQQVSDDVFEYCQGQNIGGQPEKNGRYDCRNGEERTDPVRDSDGDLELECVANGTEA